MLLVFIVDKVLENIQFERIFENTFLTVPDLRLASFLVDKLYFQGVALELLPPLLIFFHSAVLPGFLRKFKFDMLVPRGLIAWLCVR